MPYTLRTQDAALDGTPPGAPPARRPSTAAVIVGVDYAGSRGGELWGCTQAARSVPAFLRRQGAAADCAVVTDDAASGEAPTKHAVLGALQWLTHGRGPADALFAAFVGRGGGQPVSVLPADHHVAGPLLGHEAAAALLPGLPVGAHLFVLCDCADPAGALLDLPYQLTAGRDPATGQMLLRLDAPPAPPPPPQHGSVMMLSAVGGDGAAPVGGALATAFVTALNLNPRPSLQQLLADVWHVLRQRLGAGCGMPRLSASRPFAATDLLPPLCPAGAAAPAPAPAPRQDEVMAASPLTGSPYSHPSRGPQPASHPAAGSPLRASRGCSPPRMPEGMNHSSAPRPTEPGSGSAWEPPPRWDRPPEQQQQPLNQQPSQPPPTEYLNSAGSRRDSQLGPVIPESRSPLPQPRAQQQPRVLPPIARLLQGSWRTSSGALVSVQGMGVQFVETGHAYALQVYDHGQGVGVFLMGSRVLGCTGDDARQVVWDDGDVWTRDGGGGDAVEAGESRHSSDPTAQDLLEQTQQTQHTDGPPQRPLPADAQPQQQRRDTLPGEQQGVTTPGAPESFLTPHVPVEKRGPDDNWYTKDKWDEKRESVPDGEKQAWSDEEWEKAEWRTVQMEEPRPYGVSVRDPPVTEARQQQLVDSVAARAAHQLRRRAQEKWTCYVLLARQFRRIESIGAAMESAHRVRTWARHLHKWRLWLVLRRPTTLAYPFRPVRKKYASKPPPGEISEILFQAMKGLGTDEAAVYDALGSIRSDQDWADVCEAFQNTHPRFHGGDLRAALRSDLTPAELERCRTVLTANRVNFEARGGQPQSAQPQPSGKLQPQPSGRVQPQRSGGLQSAQPQSSSGRL